MIASLKPALDVLGRPRTRYLIPIFQRVYSWDRMQCDQLWENAWSAAVQHRAHFMGTLILRPEPICSLEGDVAGGEGDAGDGISQVSLIDGQQRLTTITLALVALRDEMRASGEVAAAEAVDRRYLHASPGISKLKLSEADAPTLTELIDGTPIPEGIEASQLILDAYAAFRERLASAPSTGLMLEGLGALSMVAVDLEDDDAPQQVFESLNAKGRPLSTTDLLRNALLTKHGYEEQERLFDIYWAPIDEAFRHFGAEQDIYLDAALHAWASKMAPDMDMAKRSDLYQAFKIHLAQQRWSSLESLLASISAGCLAFAADPDSPESRAHLDWATEKPQGLISQRRLFGD